MTLFNIRASVQHASFRYPELHCVICKMLMVCYFRQSSIAELEVFILKFYCGERSNLSETSEY